MSATRPPQGRPFLGIAVKAVIRFSANPEYWAGAAPIDTLVFAITPDATTRWAKLKKGECNVVPFPNRADLDEMRATPGVTVLQQEGLNIGYLGFNVEKKPFDDKRVRQALNMPTPCARFGTSRSGETTGFTSFRAITMLRSCTRCLAHPRR